MIKILVIDDDIGEPFNVYHKDFLKLYGGIENFEFIFCDGRNEYREFDVEVPTETYGERATGIGMSQEEYDSFKNRVSLVPENGAGMNGIIYDFVERVIELQHGKVSSGTRFLKQLLDDCGLDVPRKVVDALRSNTERLFREQTYIRRFVARHPGFKNHFFGF